MTKTIKKNYSKTLLASVSLSKFFISPFLLMAICLLSGCLKENSDEINIKSEFNPETKSGQEVEISIKVPETMTNMTRALADSDECHIENIEILIFEKDNTLFDYRRSIKVNDHPNPDSISIKTAKAYLPEGTYSFVFLANAKEWVNTSYRDESGMLPQKGTFYEDIINKVKATIDPEKGWIADLSNPNYRFIPMYGKKDTVTINSQNKTIDLVELDRSLAKINLTLGNSVKNKFTLQTVRLYNSNIETYLIPKNINSDSVSVAPIETVLRYYSSDTASMQNTIYLFEKENSKINSRLERFCLVVGGEYSKEGGLNYYRVDIQSNDIIIDINRNFYYEINITNINGPGSPSEDLAFRGVNTNIDFQISAWEEGEKPKGGL